MSDGLESRINRLLKAIEPYVRADELVSIRTTLSRKLAVYRKHEQNAHIYRGRIPRLEARIAAALVEHDCLDVQLRRSVEACDAQRVKTERAIERIAALREETGFIEQQIEEVSQVLFTEANESVSQASLAAHRLEQSMDRLQVTVEAVRTEVQNVAPPVPISLKKQVSDPDLLLTEKQGSRRGSRRLSMLNTMMRRADSTGTLHE